MDIHPILSTTRNKQDTVIKENPHQRRKRTGFI